MIGSQDLLIGLVIMLVLFGAKRLPELAKSIGQSMKEFKKATTQPDESPASVPPPTPPVTPAETRPCASCQAALQAEWTHCPRCGAAIRASDSAPVEPRAT
jgi:sec-independent protein translocase protein TatA